MKPASFEYYRARSVSDALEALAAMPDARVLAGGQSLVPLMNLRLARPGSLVDINDVAELDYVRIEQDGTARLGALCRHRVVQESPEIREHQALLGQAARCIANPQVRARGTVGGSLAHADPAAELPAVLLALDARVRVSAHRQAPREIPVAHLSTSFFSTSLADGELLTEIVVPARPARTRTAFAEVAPRRGDFATAGIGVALTFDEAGGCTDAVAAGCGLASTPVSLSRSLEPLLGESRLTASLLKTVAMAASAAFEPITDLHASAEDRRQLAAVLVVDAVRTAWIDAPGTAERSETGGGHAD